MEIHRRMDLVTGAGLGAGMMFLFDPARGRRRRGLARDKVIAALNTMGDATDTAGHDLVNRTHGLAAVVRSRLTRETVGDEVLVARIRARLGRVVSHPHAIEVTATDGYVTLSGPILAHEVDRLIRQVYHVHGVRDVEARLEVHKHPESVPDLQGGVPRRGDQLDLLQTHWSPTTRLLVGAAGSMLATWGAGRRDIIGAGVGTVGLGLFARAFTDMELKRLVGVGAGPCAVNIQKAINVNAPVEQVYSFWTNYENFPRFMEHVRQVRKNADGRSHWVVSGPAGVTVTFDVVVTRRAPNELVAWKTLPGSPIQHTGSVHFMTNGHGGTTVDIKMSYNPVIGGLGHSFATLLGTDPKHVLDDDMVRFKSLIEEGKTTAHGEKVTLGEIAVEPAERESAPAGQGQ